MKKGLEQFGVSVCLIAILVFFGVYVPTAAAQRGSMSVDWNLELRKAQAGIQRKPNSAFWHNQAGIAYDALGDSGRALKELKLASSLDPTNPFQDYALFAFYQRKGMLGGEREVLLNALEKDPLNPVGHFEFAHVLEKEGHLPDSLREYRKAKHLLLDVKGREYTDPRGNPYEVEPVRNQVDKAIDRVAKRVDSKQGEN